MQLWEAGAILVAGAAGGAINAAVGSGTLITFSTLVALGYSPLVANISNNLGLIGGSVAGAWGYRSELADRGAIVARMAPWSVAGGVLGAVLLLVLPSSAFDAVVPVLVALAVVLVVAQPWLAARVRANDGASDAAQADGASVDAGSGDGGMRLVGVRPIGPLLISLLAFCGAYGGYFGAAQGVLLLGVLGWLFTDSLQLANGFKNVLTATVNAVAAVIFAIAATHDVDWAIVGLLTVGATVGGLAGAWLSRRTPAIVLRGLIVVVGIVAIIRLTVF